MTSIVSFNNNTSDFQSDLIYHQKNMVMDLHDSKSPMKNLVHHQHQQQLASPDSTNNNNNNSSVPAMMTSPTYSSVQETNNNNTVTTGGRGRGRKSAPAYVQVVPGQPVSVARRNARERNRVKQVNNGFSTLRQHIPFSARNKKMSKVETLRCAVEYIRSLKRLLAENGGGDVDDNSGTFEINLDLSQNVSSSSPVSTSSEDHSLMSMSTSDVLYTEAPPSVDHSLPTSSTLLVEDYATSASEYGAPLRGGVILQTAPSRLIHQLADNDVVFDDSPLPPHPNALIRHGSSLSPGYSDRSSVNSPAASHEVSTTGFMGVFAAAAAAGLDKTSSGMMMDLSRAGVVNSSGMLQQALIFKKERLGDEEMIKDMIQRGGLVDIDGTNSAELMDVMSWWELEQARRMQQQQQQPQASNS